jgi:hypothetical protein
MYDPVGGRFVSRDPIGYPDGASGYLSYFAGSMLDPSGTVTVLKTPSSEVGHPWSNTPRLGAHVLGQTDANVNTSYKCTPVTTVQFEGGGVGAGYYPARNVCVGCKATFTINVATEIKIDVTKISRYAGHTTEGTYGHE